MPKIKYKIIPLNKLFMVGRGLSKYTKTYADEHKGNYPVYSSKTDDDGVFANIDTYDYDGEYLTWSTDGYAGLPAYRNGKFSCTDHCGILTLKNEFTNVYLPYIRWQVDFRKLRLGYGNQRVKVNQVKNSNIDIKIPINEQGEFDIKIQKQLADTYLQIDEQRTMLLSKINELKNISVRIENDSSINWREVKPIDLFNPKGGNMSYSKTWAKENPGNYPLYSGTTFGAYDLINRADYNGEYLSWCIDGLAGYMMYHNESFSITCHRGVLIPRDDVDFSNIDLKYIKYVLEPVFRKRKKGREGDLGKNEYTSLKPTAIRMMKDTIPIPVKEDGSFDLDKQKELAAKYEQIDEIKTGLINKILELTDIIIS